MTLENTQGTLKEIIGWYFREGMEDGENSYKPWIYEEKQRGNDNNNLSFQWSLVEWQNLEV